MQIFGNKKDTNLLSKLKNFWTSFKLWIFIITYSFVLLIAGMLIHKFGFSENFRKTQIEIVNSYRSVVAKFKAKPVKIKIDINHKNYQRIVFNRDQALKHYMHIPADDDYVSAKITPEGASPIKVKLRLKGVHSDHWKDLSKWSLRVKTKDEKLFGMKHFALMPPWTRDYIHEWIYLQSLKREGLISLRMQFVDVTINGKHKGIYALEEHYGKELLENNGRTPGPIVSFNKDLFEQELIRFEAKERVGIKKNSMFEKSSVAGAAVFESSPIVGSQVGQIISNPEDLKNFQKAVSLLEKVRTRQIKASQAFDPDEVAMFLALRALSGALSTDQNDTKFYYNPLSNKLEPIGSELHYGYDLTVGKWWLNQKEDIKKPFLSLFFDDPVIYEAYLKALKKVSKKSYLDKLFSDIDSDLQKNLSIIYSDYHGFNFDKNQYYRNQKYIRNMLDPIKGLHAYFSSWEKDILELEIGNIQAMPVEVIGLTYGNNIFIPLEPIYLKSKEASELVNYNKCKFNLKGLKEPASQNEKIDFLNKLKINYRFSKEGLIKSDKVFFWKRI